MSFNFRMNFGLRAPGGPGHYRHPSAIVPPVGPVQIWSLRDDAGLKLAEGSTMDSVAGNITNLFTNLRQQAISAIPDPLALPWIGGLASYVTGGASQQFATISGQPIGSQGGGTPSAGTGPGTNNRREFLYYETSSGNPGTPDENADFIIDGGTDARSVLNNMFARTGFINPQMEVTWNNCPSDGAGGRQLILIERDSAGVEIARTVREDWAYSNAITTDGTDVTDGAGVTFGALTGNWRQETFTLNDATAQVEFDFKTGSDASYLHDICFADIRFIAIPTGTPPSNSDSAFGPGYGEGFD